MHQTVKRHTLVSPITQNTHIHAMYPEHRSCMLDAQITSDQCNRNIESVNIHTLNVYTYTCLHTHVCAYMHTTNTHAHTYTKCTHISYMLLLHTHVYTHTHNTHTQSHTYAACSLTLGVYTELVATVTISPFQKVTFKN